jgi:hypothetical protein
MKGEILVKKRKYLRIPEEISTLDGDPLSASKLSLHFCSNGKIYLSDQEWPNLEYLEIIGSGYLEINLNYKNPSKIKALFIANSQYLDFTGIQGHFPQWSTWDFESTKYVKFKGAISGENALKTLIARKSPYLDLFQAKCSLPHLTTLVFDTCHFLKLNLEPLNAPRLVNLGFINSNYVNIVSLGNIQAHLHTFSFQNCVYPKLGNVDFARLQRLESDVSTSDIAQMLSTHTPQIHGPFRGIRTRSEVDLAPIHDQMEKDLTAANPPSIKIEADLSEIEGALDLEEPSMDRKFCSTCGHENKPSAQFCANCGEKLRI